VDLPLDINIVNLFGFIVGGILYMTLATSVGVTKDRRAAADRRRNTDEEGKSFLSAEYLLIAAAVLGCFWNFGELAIALWLDFFRETAFPVFSAALYSALGFLPALIVHLERRNEARDDLKNPDYLILAGYVLSVAAVALHFFAALYQGKSFSPVALQILATGYLIIAAVIFVSNREDVLKKRIARVLSLVLFAFSLFHLGFPQTEGRLWYIEIVGHQASLPLVVAVLYRNFRFAFADLFLKRALSLTFLATVIYAAYSFVVVPVSALHAGHPADDPQRTGVLLFVWTATALLYPQIHRFSAWLVDKTLLQRPDYAHIEKEFMQKIQTFESVGDILSRAARDLASIVSAPDFEIRETKDSRAVVLGETVEIRPDSAKITIPTVEAPNFEIILSGLSGKRQVLSEEIAALETLALQTARRVDVLRVSHERCERELREQEFSALATEAELRALRSQINPHFLFNALTTIGYLINAAPEKALSTLLRLTGLLRGVLGVTKEFQTLGEEMKLIESYLEIEKARFEERLAVEINLPASLAGARIPALVLQPLVENAVKHGISPQKTGGKIEISAKREEEFLVLRVRDTGAGFEEDGLSRRIENRVGLKNIRDRLKLHYGEAAWLDVRNSPAGGAVVEIKIEAARLDENFSLNKTPERKTLTAING
jgi:two-component system, LytTR family, sensor kinase